jgi:hypothetical protein
MAGVLSPLNADALKEMVFDMAKPVYRLVH